MNTRLEGIQDTKDLITETFVSNALYNHSEYSQRVLVRVGLKLI